MTGVELTVCESRDSVQGAELAVGNKIHVGIDEPRHSGCIRVFGARGSVSDQLVASIADRNIGHRCAGEPARRSSCTFRTCTRLEASAFLAPRNQFDARMSAGGISGERDKHGRMQKQSGCRTRGLHRGNDGLALVSHKCSGRPNRCSGAPFISWDRIIRIRPGSDRSHCERSRNLRG
jgi:hypothetical protein